MSSLCIMWKMFKEENLAFASFSRQKFVGKVCIVGAKQYIALE